MRRYYNYHQIAVGMRNGAEYERKVIPVYAGQIRNGFTKQGIDDCRLDNLVFVFDRVSDFLLDCGSTAYYYLLQNVFPKYCKAGKGKPVVLL